MGVLLAGAIKLIRRAKKEYFWRRVKKNSEVVGKSSFRMGARIEKYYFCLYLLLIKIKNRI